MNRHLLDGRAHKGHSLPFRTVQCCKAIIAAVGQQLTAKNSRPLSTVQLSAYGKLSADAQLKGAAASAIVSFLSWDEDNNGFLFA